MPVFGSNSSEKDSNGDIQPTYVKQGATEVDCSDGGPQVWSNNGFCMNGFCNDGRWRAYYRKQLGNGMIVFVRLAANVFDKK